MGLDVVFGLDVGYPLNTLETRSELAQSQRLYEAMQECLARHGLPVHQEPHQGGGNTPGRAYPFWELGEYCRAQAPQFAQLSAIVCSEFQMLVPVDFSSPLPLFDIKKPEDFGLVSARPTPEFREEAIRFSMHENRWSRKHAEREFSNTWDMRYPYYTDTPAENIFLLSCQQLCREAESFNATIVPEEFRRGLLSGEYDDDRTRNLSIPVHALRFVHYCCTESMNNNRLIWFSG